MAMDFWAAQRRARSKTFLYLTIFVILTLVVAFLSEMIMRSLAGDSYDTNIPVIGLIYLSITFLVAGYQYLMMRAFGGRYVAESVGAEEVDPQTNNFQEKQLLNIVQEMAIAAGVPVPPVYIMPVKAINAFAAGMNKDNAAITVTTGSMKLLNRDELQGVIAHEFGHIYNGDMKISMRLAAMIMGFFCVLWLGTRLLQVAGIERGGREKGANPVALAALILMVAGSITWLAGNILKCSISREREYLADACAVQFTRNPEGIANALRRIANESTHAMPADGMSISHMYFDDHSGFSSLFATHPPLEKRIAAIEGREYIPDDWNIPK
jgi:heat shock protein HtpX